MDISNSFWLLIGILIGMGGVFPVAYLLGRMIGPEEKDDELNPTTQEWIAKVQELVDTLTEMDDEED